MKITGSNQVLFHHNGAHTSEIFLRLNKLRQDDLLCDLTIIVQGQKFKAHKVVMAASSNYLLAAMRSEKAVVSVADQNHTTIELDHVTTRGFAPLLDYAYTSELSVGAGDVIDVLAAASYMQMFDVARACSEFMRSSWTQFNQAPLVNLQLLADRSTGVYGSQINDTRNTNMLSTRSTNLPVPTNSLWENEISRHIPVDSAQHMSTIVPSPHSTGKEGKDLSSSRFYTSPNLQNSAEEKENKRIVPSSDTASFPLSTSVSVHDFKMENPSFLSSHKQFEASKPVKNQTNELQQKKVDATRSDYNAEMLEEVSKSSSSSSNDSFTSMPNTARKLSDEIMEKKLPNNNSFPSEKSAGTEMLYPMNETASSNALDSWQRLQQHFYNLRQSEQLRTIWNPSNLFAAGHRSKSVEMLRNHFTPYTNNHPEMSSGTAVNSSNIPKLGNPLSLLSSFNGLPFHRQFLQRQFLAHQPPQYTSPGANQPQEGNAMFPKLPAVPPNGQYTSVRRRTLQSNVPKPHQCQICGSKFTRYHNLKQHIKLHSGVKPYECDVCGKRFTRNYTLRLHKMKHIGLRNFRCGTCDAAFTSLGEFRAHLRLTMHSHFSENKGETPIVSHSKEEGMTSPSRLSDVPPSKFSRFSNPMMNYGVISPGSSGGGASGEESTGTISPPTNENTETGSPSLNTFYTPTFPKTQPFKPQIISNEDNKNVINDDPPNISHKPSPPHHSESGPNLKQEEKLSTILIDDE